MMQGQKKKPIAFTQAGYDAVQSEFLLIQSQRPEAVENLRKAREMGDLSENGYYKAARARLSFLDSRLRYLERLVKQGVIVQATSNDVVEIGSTVTLTDADTEYTYTIVGGYESNPAKQTISHQSPIGRALMGKKVGDVVEVHAPAGTSRYTIQRISPQ